MPITKKYLKARPVCKVRFKLEPGDFGDANKIFLVGSFNGWNETSHPLKKAKDGSFGLELDFPVQEEISFRYLTDDGRWINEKGADEFRYCEFAGNDNSILKFDI